MIAINHLPARLRQLRENNGFSQEYVAEQLEISQNTYSRLESGQTKITVERLFAIVPVLNTDIIEILAISFADISPATNHRKEIRKISKKLALLAQHLRNLTENPG